MRGTQRCLGHTAYGCTLSPLPLPLPYHKSLGSCGVSWDIHSGVGRRRDGVNAAVSTPLTGALVLVVVGGGTVSNFSVRGVGSPFARGDLVGKEN